MKIPRKGMVFVIRRGKAKRKVRVVIESLHRRLPQRAVSDGLTNKARYQVYYVTEGTWAAHGRRTMRLRGFLKLAVPA